jgi:predicted phage gp36 major capsid-like protein
MTNTNVHFANLVSSVSIEAIDKFKAYMSDKVEIDDDMSEIFESFKAQLVQKAATGQKAGHANGDGTTEKKKRSLSPYNLYIQQKMQELKQQGHTGNLMKLAIAAYNKEKELKKTGEVPTEIASEEQQTEQ